MSDKYFPEQVTEITPEYLFRELQRISWILEQIQEGPLPITYTEPDKPREGMIRYADGTNWSPPNGIGKGLYLYDGEIWRPIG